METASRKPETASRARPKANDDLSIERLLDLQLSSLPPGLPLDIRGDLQGLRALLDDLGGDAERPEFMGAVFDSLLDSLKRANATASSIVRDSREFHADFEKSSQKLAEINRRIDERLDDLIGR